MKFRIFIVFFFPVAAVAQSPSPGGVGNTNLTFWLKADAGITESGGNVSQWNDQSNSAFHVSQTLVTKRPRFSVDTMNYHPAIYFDGNDILFRELGPGSHSAILTVQNGFNKQTTGSIFTVASSRRREYANFFSQFPSPGCGDYIFSSDVSSGKLRVGGRSRPVGVMELADYTVPFLASAVEAPGTSNAAHYLNGGNEVIVSNVNGKACDTIQTVRIGSGLNGTVAEAIAFNVKLNDTERRKVESYLAIKYGITLNNEAGGIFGDYINTAGITVWDASVGAAYQNRVLGIGRDNDAGLNQRQSHDNEDSIRIYLGTLAATNNSNGGSLNNGEFVIIGDDNAPLTNNNNNVEYPNNLSITNRISREWKITNTGFAGNFSLDLKPSGGSYDASRIRMLVDADGDFATGAILYAPTVSYTGGVLTLSGLSPAMLPTGETRYLAIVTIAFPGGVSGAAFWTKANEGVYADGGSTPATSGNSIQQWNDISGNALHLSQVTAGEKPTFLNGSAAAFNYNPVVHFSNNYLKTDSADGVFLNGSSYDNIHVYTVHRDEEADNFDWLYYEGGNPGGNSVRAGFNFFGTTTASYAFSDLYNLTASTTTAIPTGVTNIVGHHAGTGGNYGQDSNRHTVLMANGREVSSAAAFDGYTVSATGAVYLGDNKTGNGESENSPFTGQVGEVLVYLKELNSNERNRIESYLALKYGKTLDNSDDDNADGDYLSSGGDVLWDASTGSGYHNDVIGIVRDNSSGLLQKQSHQADDSTRIYIAALAATNAQNTGTISDNLSAVIIGHNLGKLKDTPGANDEIPAASLVNIRLEREWKVTNTAFNQPFNLDIRLDTPTLGTINPDNLALLVDADGDFTNANVYTYNDGLGFQYSGDMISVSGISSAIIPANSTQYITLAKVAVTPGGIAGTRLWVKADAGVFSDFGTEPALPAERVKQWNDFSGNNIHLFQPGSTDSSPVFLNGSSVVFNYNPALQFDNSYLRSHLVNGLFASGATYNHINIYTVHHDMDANDVDWLYYEGSSTTSKVSAGFNLAGSSEVTYNIADANQMNASSSTDIPPGTTNIVGHHAGNINHYGQGNNRYGALMVNGKETDSLTAFSGYTHSGADEFYLGDNKTNTGDNPDNPFTGYIGEVMVYLSPLDPASRNHIESYLAIKYGKTLSNAAGVTHGDYTSSGGTIVWDADDKPGYHNNIIGISRDDNSLLYQRQSHTANDTLRLYLSTLASVNMENTGIFNGDEQFVLMGDDNGAIANNMGNTEYPGNLSIRNRVAREWKITNTGFSGSFSIDIKPGGGTFNADEIRILIDDDSNFTNAVMHAPAVSYADGVLTLGAISNSMIPLNSTRYLAIVTLDAPGGAAPALWIKANQGVFSDAGTTPATDGQTVQQWTDVSGSNNHLSQSESGQRPIYQNGSANAFNYNPVLAFSNEVLTTTTGDGLFASGQQYDNIHIFTVHEDLSNPDFNWLYYEGAAYRNRVSAGYYNFPELTDSYYNVTNSEAQQASTATDLVPNTVNIVAHNVGSLPIYGQANDKYRALVVNGEEVSASGEVFSGYTPKAAAEFTLGNTSGDNDLSESAFAGYFGEMIVYKNSLTAAQRNQVESYLAIKYGKTLSNAAGGTDGDYLSSADTVWDADNNSNYHRQVIGIGRDDNSRLLQKQSHTSDDTTRLYLASLQSTNSENTGNFGNDNSFVMAGHNGGYMFSIGSTEYPDFPEPEDDIYSRLDREWKITNTGFSETFSMDFSLSPTPILADDLRVLIDDDGDFNDATMYGSPEVGIAYSNGIITINNINTTLIPVGSTRYLTIVSLRSSTTLPLWLVAFTARETSRRTVMLEWKTDGQIDCNSFEVERSVKNNEWQQLGTVEVSTRQNTNTYTFEDIKPANGTNYYRLKMMCGGGSSSWNSDVRTVRLQQQKHISVYPNPVARYITLSAAGKLTSEDWKMYDVTGRDITARIKMIARSDQEITIDMGTAPAGIYFLRVEGKTYKVLKE